MRKLRIFAGITLLSFSPLIPCCNCYAVEQELLKNREDELKLYAQKMHEILSKKQAALEKLQAESVGRKNEITQLKNKILELEEQLKKKQEEESDLALSFSEELKRELSNETMRYDALKHSLQEKGRELGDHYESYNMEKSSWTAQQRRYEEQLQGLKLRENELKDNILMLSTTYGILQGQSIKDKEALAREISGLKESLEQERDKLLSLEEALHFKHLDQELALGTLKAVKEELAEKDQLLAYLKESLEKAEKHLDNHHERYETDHVLMDIAQRNYENEIGALREKEAKLKDLTANLRSSMHETTQDLDSHYLGYQLEKAYWLAKQEEYENASKLQDNHEEEVRSLQTGIEEQNKQIFRLGEALEMLLEKSLQDRKELAEEIALLRETLDQERKKFGILEEELTLREAGHENLRLELEHKENLHNASKEEMAALIKELSSLLKMQTTKSEILEDALHKEKINAEENLSRADSYKKEIESMEQAHLERELSLIDQVDSHHSANKSIKKQIAQLIQLLGKPDSK